MTGMTIIRGIGNAMEYVEILVGEWVLIIEIVKRDILQGCHR